MAILPDSFSTSGGSSVTSVTFSHTCSGANRILWVAIYSFKSTGGDIVSGVTYNSVPMTLAGKLARDSGQGEIYLYYLINPASGANNVVVSYSVSVDGTAVRAASYTGARQSGVPDMFTSSGPTNSATSMTTTGTTIEDNCWLVGFFTKDTAGNFTAGANTTIRNSTSQNVLVDSNGAQSPAGSKSMNCTGASGQYAALMASFAPAVTDLNFGEYIGAGSAITKLLLHLNGNSADDSGNGNNGTDTAITHSLANGKFGQGAGFNGSSSRIAGSIVQPTSAYTIAMWVKNGGISVADTNYRLFDTQNTGGGANGVVFAYNPSLSGSTKNLRVYHNNGSWATSNDLGTLLQSGYHLVGVTWDGSNASFYVDGERVGNPAYSTSITNDGGYYVGAGRATSTFWNGQIDEVIVENVAWSPAKFKKHYTYTKGRFGII